MLPLAALVIALAPAHELSLERIFEDPPLAGRAPAALQLAPGGKSVTFLKGSEKDSEVLDLWGADLPSGTPRKLVATDDLLGGKAQKLTEQERMALERKRIRTRGITGYLWCGHDAKAVIFPLSGDLYYVTLADRLVTRLTHDEDVPELNPVCSKSGKQVAFVKNNDVVVMDIATRKTQALTHGGSAVHHFGLPEFIAEEEMDRHAGMWWSPDGKSLLVFEVDETPVGKKVRAQIFADHTEMFEQRYPAAGENNAVVTPWLIELSGRKQKLWQPAEDGYLPRAGFFPDGAPWLEWQSRDQKTVRVLEGKHDVVVEKDNTWVELTDDFIPLKDGKRALWTTEKSGRRQIVVVDRKTGQQRVLTDEPEPVQRIAAVDDERGVVFYTAWRDRGRQMRAFSIPVDPPGNAAPGTAAVCLTPEPGWHAVGFDDAGRFFVDHVSDFGVPPQTKVLDATGKTVLVLDDNPAAELAGVEHSQPVWLDLLAADGKTKLNGLLLPPTRRPKGERAPLIVSIYGGPTAQTVTHAWSRGFPMETYWAEQGFGVFLVDNRGMAGRDHAFTRAHDHAFGDIEVKDLFAAVKQVVASTPWIDKRRIGVFGWSYGGFLSTRAILDAGTPFAAAVAVAPVTDWTLYDTHYTERYLGMPGKDGKAPAYENANLVRRAKLLNKPFLLLHGTADDNVLFEHSLRLIEALENEEKLFDLSIYPGKAHGITGRRSQLHVYKTITTFFRAHL